MHEGPVLGHIEPFGVCKHKLDIVDQPFLVVLPCKYLQKLDHVGMHFLRLANRWAIVEQVQ